MKSYFYIFLVSALFFTSALFAQGLKFGGGELPIDKRTSYTVFGETPVTFSDSFKIEFNLAFFPAKEIGYIIRIKNRGNNVIYNLFYDGQGHDLVFKFNEEGKSSLFTAQIGREELPDSRWMKMSINFDLKNDTITLAVHNKTFSVGNQNLPDGYHPVIVFGKSDHIIDVPSFAIKDLTVGDNRKYTFELRENKGNTVSDLHGKIEGEVQNPEWLINEAYHWTFKTSFKSKTVAGANYNHQKKKIYYFNSNSIFTYNVRTGEKTTTDFAIKCPVNMALGTNFIDETNSRLYVYEVYYDNHQGGATMASLNLETCEWTAENFGILSTQLHHHVSCFNPLAGKYTIFGGFGNMYYNRNFYSFDLNMRTWTMLTGFKGDTLFPRYFSSAASAKEAGSMYVFGGMGNESGEQVVGRKYFYDLYKVNLNTKQITKLWETDMGENNIVPVRNMIIQGDTSFYTLCYPEHFSESFLQLYRFSMKDGSYEILGDSIPICSDKITTNANLYYDEQLNTLYATIQEFDDDIESSLKVYTLAFPPITAEDLISYPKKQKSAVHLILLAVCAAVATAGYFVYRTARRKNAKEVEDEEELDEVDVSAVKELLEPATHKPNSIYLFGEFTIRDRRSKDITYMFSAKLKQVFCLILQHSLTDGITSHHLSDLLWPDRPEDKVKNSRGVTINHLRKVLDEIDGIELSYNKSFYKFILTEECYCDFVRCVQIISSKQIKENRDELITILTRGKFLKSQNDELFDSFKEEVERILEPVLLFELKNSFAAGHWQTTIELSDLLFNIDPLNDEALTCQIKSLQKLKMDEKARIRYQIYVTEYKKMMGENYPFQYKTL